MTPFGLRNTTHKAYAFQYRKGCDKMKERLLLPLIVLALIFAGCSANKKASPKPAPQSNGTQRVQQTAPKPKQPQNAKATADRLVKLASSVPKVNSATAVVFGKVAIVGIDVDARLDRSRVGTIKYSVAEALREDPQGARALITADPDIVQRLKEINADIRRGRPIAGFAEELADIAGRIVPQAPPRLLERNQLRSTKQ